EAHGADIPFALFYLPDRSAPQARLAAVAGKPEEGFDPRRVVPLDGRSGPDDPWQLAEVRRTRLPQAIADVTRQARGVPRGPWPDPPKLAVTLPIKAAAADSLAGFLILGVSPRLRFDDAYAGFLDLVTAQVASAVASARAYEEEKTRAEALAELDRAK